MVRTRVTVRASRGRIALWSAAAVLCGFLSYRLLVEREPVAVEEPVPAAERGGAAGPSPPVGLRFGVAPRTSHLVALSGLEMGLYDLALQGEGVAQPIVEENTADLERALSRGDLDVACLPLRRAVRVAASGGGRIVAGAALGGESFVASQALSDPASAPLGDLRVGIVEPPLLDLRRIFEDLDDPPTLLLLAAGDMGKRLLAGRLDMALLPEPDAHAVAPVGRARIVRLPEGHPRAPLSGAVLVAGKRLLADAPDLVERLVGIHAVSAEAHVARDPRLAAKRALALLTDAGVAAAPLPLWTASLETVRFGYDIPEQRLRALIDVGRESGELPEDLSIGDLVEERFVAEARRDLGSFESDR